MKVSKRLLEARFQRGIALFHARERARLEDRAWINER